jgi:hypothetical protein
MAILSNPHLGQDLWWSLYLGVSKYGHFQPAFDFSTAKGTYPQKIASYPHIQGLDKRQWGNPLPPNMASHVCWKAGKYRQ